jgi:endo-1,4-beta-xylanase
VVEQRLIVGIKSAPRAGLDAATPAGMRSLTAISIVTLTQCVLGCGNFDSQTGDDDCVDGKCDGQSAYARRVVVPESPLALSNPNEERVTWPLWGSAFTLDEDVRARVSLQATGKSGVVFAFAGDPEERRAFELMWTGTEWKLSETVGGGAAVQAKTVTGGRDADFVVEVVDGGRTVRVVSGGTVRASLTTSSAVTGPMGIYVQVEPGAQLGLDDVRVSQPIPPAETSAPLKALAAAHGRAFGSTSETGEWPPRHDTHFEAMWSQQFDTAGILDFFWTTSRGEDDDFYFLPADLNVNYATVRGQTINGYFLVWDMELPEWLNDAAEQGDSAFGAVYDKHIETLVTRYKGRVSSWIVVNEAFLGPDENGTDAADYSDTLFYRTLGAEHIARAFRVADHFDPDATLIYNETTAEAEGPKSDFMYARIKELVTAGVPIDAVGFQFHIDAAHAPDMASVKRNLERFAALGLDVLITELDVNLAYYPGTHEQRLQKQAELFGAVIQTCLAVPACKTITTFGFSDKHAWDELGPAVCKPEGNDGLCSEPLIYDRQYVPKPAYHSVRTALGG